jgi:hypothetical protein
MSGRNPGIRLLSVSPFLPNNKGCNPEGNNATGRGGKMIKKRQNAKDQAQSCMQGKGFVSQPK